jgi:hypothetical protein
MGRRQTFVNTSFDSPMHLAPISSMLFLDSDLGMTP